MRRKAGTVIPLANSSSSLQEGSRSARSQKAAHFFGEEFEEAGLGDSPSRSLMQRLGYPPRISLNAFLIGLLCVMLLILLGFVPLSLPIPLHLGATSSNDAPLLMRYTLQLPMALFLSAFLGPFIGVMVVTLYIVLGLTVAPVFANGGGLSYVLQPGFGYWLGALASAFWLSRRFHKAFQKESGGGSLKIARMALTAIALTHAIGMGFVIFLTVFGQVPAADLPGWVLRLTLEPFPYDLLAAVVLLSVVRQVRLLLCFVLY
jgi:biotin transporter BioY